MKLPYHFSDVEVRWGVKVNFRDKECFINIHTTGTAENASDFTTERADFTESRLCTTEIVHLIHTKDQDPRNASIF
jgi:hypothetical protein